MICFYQVHLHFDDVSFLHGKHAPVVGCENLSRHLNIAQMIVILSVTIRAISVNVHSLVWSGCFSSMDISSPGNVILEHVQ